MKFPIALSGARGAEPRTRILAAHRETTGRGRSWKPGLFQFSIRPLIEDARVAAPGSGLHPVGGSSSGSFAIIRRDPSRLVINLSVHLLIPAAISPPEMDGIEPIVRRVAAMLGGTTATGGMLMDTQDHLGRGLAIGAGHLTVAMRAELGRLLAASRGDKRKALAAGLSELHTRKILHAKEATELAAIMEMFFDAPDGHDSKLAHRASTYFQALSIDFDSSPAALAIASVISSLTSPSRAGGTGTPHVAAAASRAGDAAFGGFGAVVGAGIGWGIGGPIGAGVGAVVGAAVGVCISEG